MSSSTRTHTFRFLPRPDAMPEYHICIRVTDPELRYENQLSAVLQAASEAAAGKSVHFRRFFLSDAANQAPALTRALAALPAVPTCIVQQAPLDGTRIALWMYGTGQMEAADGLPAHNGFAHHWAASMTHPGADSRTQMEGIFDTLDGALAAREMKVARDTVRTWILVRDVDVNYAGVVAGRRAYFDRIGLTASTHYIASTGIEGRHPDPERSVEMDVYSVKGLQEGQIRHLYARDHLSPTYDYGVTFERGTAVTYGDRRQVFISGTASIDAQGKVLHPGDVAAQAGRMLENVSALLAEAGAGLKDLAMAIVYLRDPADAPRVREIVSRACPELEPFYVLGPVCRPAWLVEMECIALVPGGDPAFRDF